MGSKWDRFRCRGALRGRLRCWFNVQPGSDYCPGHQADPDSPCDMEAVGRYQAEHGVDYPCGKPDDLERVFDPEDYQKVSVELPTPPEHIPVTDEVATLMREGLASHSIGGGLRVLNETDYLGGEIQLSNKACPRYYRSAYVAAQKKCCCPEGRCWYDEQLARRSRVQRALTTEAWHALIAGTADERGIEKIPGKIIKRDVVLESDYHFKGDEPEPVTEERMQRDLAMLDAALKPVLGKPKKKKKPRSIE